LLSLGAMPDRSHFLFLAALAFNTTACSEKSAATGPPLRFGMDLSYPPLVMQDTVGKPDSVGAKIAETLAAKLNRPLQSLPMEFSGLIPALRFASTAVSGASRQKQISSRSSKYNLCPADLSNAF